MAHERVPLWNNLRLLSQDISSPWVVSGDFNCVTAMEEMAGGREQWTPDMQQFKDIILQAGLAHLRTIGPLLTWSNKRPNNLVHRRFDRMLGKTAWLHEFSESWVHVKTKGIMDHAPLLLHIPMQLEKIRKPFQFFNFMRDIIGFQEAVMRGWAYTCSGDPMSILYRKLKEVKVELKTLNKQHGNLHTNVSIARTNLQEIREAIDMDPLNSVLCKSESEATKNLDKCIQEEENLLQQKGRWNRNKILSIENNNGEIVFGHQAVTNVAIEFFSNSLGSPPPLQEIDLRSLQCAQVTDNQASLLLMGITPEIILSTLKTMKKNSAPGPDGFNVEFFLSTWDIIGDVFCKAVKHFFDSGQMNPGINSTAIALIPKTLTPTHMKDYRPISLCCVAYKFIVKILANHIKPLMSTLIHSSQSAFIPGRSISDNILLAQELFRGYQRQSGVPRCALKIDLHNAFDSITWDFIFAALNKMRFPDKFVQWLRACITTPRFSVKINGALTGYFRGAKGLRQGDPLSPYIFSICMNVLSCLLSNSPSNFHHHWKCKSLKINHLFYADDVLLFSRGDKDSIHHIMSSLDGFSKLSGLKPSIHKSTIFLSNCTTEVVYWCDQHYGVPHGSLPVKFLGVPLISSQLSTNDCMPLIERLLSKMVNWTNFLLSFAGRARLIKVVLNSIQAFWTNHFLLPKGVHRHIRKLLTRFLWKGDTKKKGGAKVSWQKLCLPKYEGGLGIRDPEEWNHSQLLCHLCKIVSRKDSLWVQWVLSTHLKHSSIWLVTMPNDCSWIWRQILQLRDSARRFISFDIGNGANTFLWMDPWWQNECLANHSNDNVCLQARSTMTAKVSSIINLGTWRLPQLNSSLHHFNPKLISWINTFNFPTIDSSKSDRVTWCDLDLKRIKTWFIWDKTRYRGQDCSWSPGVWHNLVVPRYAFLEWLICLGRLPTQDRLIRFVHFQQIKDDSCWFHLGAAPGLLPCSAA
ncbi:hypothetical protein AgCh_024056 [Apium graveolens]